MKNGHLAVSQKVKKSPLPYPLYIYFSHYIFAYLPAVLGDKTIADLRSNKATYLSDTDIKGKNLWNSTERVILLKHRADVREVIPKVMRPILDCSTIQANEHMEITWWRAVSAAFILRPNRATQALMDKYRRDIKVTHLNPSFTLTLT